MRMKQFEKKVLSRAGAPERVAVIERRLLVAQALGDVRRRRKVSTRGKRLPGTPSRSVVTSSSRSSRRASELRSRSDVASEPPPS
jgi:hypothetical protein